MTFLFIGSIHVQILTMVTWEQNVLVIMVICEQNVLVIMVTCEQNVLVIMVTCEQNVLVIMVTCEQNVLVIMVTCEQIVLVIMVTCEQYELANINISYFLKKIFLMIFSIIYLIRVIFQCITQSFFLWFSYFYSKFNLYLCHCYTLSHILRMFVSKYNQMVNVSFHSNDRERQPRLGISFIIHR